MPSFKHESRLEIACGGPVAGVDEAGRGPWAGPVVAAAVIFEKKRVPRGLDDSKKLSPERREELFAIIHERARAIGVGLASSSEIDTVNIRQATHLAMRRAVEALAFAPHAALVDGNDPPPLGCLVETLIGGDGLSSSIAAASIVAKVTRDRMMAELDALYPGYAFAAHKGYGTPEHREALDRLGPCPEHRRSYAPVRERQLRLALGPQDVVGGEPLRLKLTL